MRLSNISPYPSNLLLDFKINQRSSGNKNNKISSVIEAKCILKLIVKILIGLKWFNISHFLLVNELVSIIKQSELTTSKEYSSKKIHVKQRFSFVDKTCLQRDDHKTTSTMLPTWHNYPKHSKICFVFLFSRPLFRESSGQPLILSFEQTFNAIKWSQCFCLFISKQLSDDLLNDTKTINLLSSLRNITPEAKRNFLETPLVVIGVKFYCSMSREERKVSFSLRNFYILVNRLSRRVELSFVLSTWFVVNYLLIRTLLKQSVIMFWMHKQA